MTDSALHAADDHKNLADYAFVFDTVGRFSGATTEAAVRDSVLELFTMLCAPSTMMYLPVHQGVPGELTVCSDIVRSARDRQTELNGLLASKSESEWTASQTGFILRVLDKDEMLVVLKIDGLAEPARRQHYLNLARNFLPMLRITILNARTFQQLQSEIAERKRFEAALKTAATELSNALERSEEALQIRDEFISIASHELKTPLTSLRLQYQLRQKMLSKYGTEAFEVEKLRQLLDKDLGQLGRMERLIEDMLDVARIKSGRLSLEKERFDIAALANELIDRYVMEGKLLGCPVTRDISGPAWGEWDRMRIEQVLSNLLTNALKYGGRSAIHLSVRKNDSVVEMEVSDQGPGIPREYQERIFKRFERVENGTAVAGLGLGLYIVRKILDLHGGSIRVESEPGQGARFIVSLPL